MNFTVGRYLTLCVLLGGIVACSNQARVAIPSLPSAPKSTGRDAMDGIASWYGKFHHGRRAASGEIYNMYRLTAAHRTLPFDTIVRVKNKSNGREVDVRINDRGPYITGRVIDLSYAAAQALDMVQAGIVPVKLKIMQIARQFPGQMFSVQVVACDSQWPAEANATSLFSFQPGAACVQSPEDLAPWTQRSPVEYSQELPRDTHELFVLLREAAVVGLDYSVMDADML